MIAKRDLPACPVATTVGIIGNKWKLLILRDILSGPRRFGELRKNLDGISQKVLTESLRSMEQDGILNRTAFAEVPPRVEYTKRCGPSSRRWKVGATHTNSRAKTERCRRFRFHPHPCAGVDK